MSGALIPYIDVFLRDGKPMCRIDLALILRSHDIILQEIQFIKFPKLNWSHRKIEEVETYFLPLYQRCESIFKLQTPSGGSLK